MKQILAVLLVILIGFQVRSQWTQVNLFTGDIRDIDTSDSLVFVAAGMAGVYKSNNPQSGWTYWSQQFVTPPFSSCVGVRDSIVFCGGSQDEIFRSTDNGTTWTNSVLNLGPNILLKDVCIGDSFVFALSANYGLYRSPDTGDTWQQCNDPIPAFYMEKLFDDGNVIYLLSKDSGLYRSTDNGMSWLAVNNGFYPSCQVKSLLRKDSTLVLGTACGYVYLSTDNGFNWTMTGVGTGSQINCMVLLGSDLYAGTYQGVYRSTDNGHSWFLFNNGIFHSPVNSLGVFDNNLIAGTQGGVYLLSNGSVTWDRACEGISGGYFLDISKKTGDIYTYDNIAGVFYSNDNGDTWNLKNSGMPDFNLFMLENAGSLVFSGSYNGVYSTTNMSQTWSIEQGLPVQNSRTMTTLGNDIFIGFENGQLFRSSDFGNTWSLSSQGLPGTSIGEIVTSDNELFVYTNDAIYSSVNNGINWNYKSSMSGIFHIATTPSSIMIDVNENYIMTSTDQGTTWALCSFPVTPNILIISDILAVGDDYFVSCNKGVYHSADNGTTWTDISAGLPVPNTKALGYDGVYIFVDTERNGIFRLPANLVTENLKTTTEEFTLFPNPADGVINVKGESEISEIRICDVTGRIVIEKNNVKGNGVCIDVSSLSEGVYFVNVNGIALSLQFCHIQH